MLYLSIYLVWYIASWRQFRVLIYNNDMFHCKMYLRFTDMTQVIDKTGSVYVLSCLYLYIHKNRICIWLTFWFCSISTGYMCCCHFSFSCGSFTGTVSPEQNTSSTTTPTMKTTVQHPNLQCKHNYPFHKPLFNIQTYNVSTTILSTNHSSTSKPTM